MAYTAQAQNCDPTLIECNAGKGKAQKVINSKTTIQKNKTKSTIKQVANKKNAKQVTVIKVKQVQTAKKVQPVVKQKAQTNVGQYIIIANALNVRSLPRQDSRILGTLRKGSLVSLVTPTSPTPYWKRIKFGKTYGWVSAKYIKKVH